MLEGFKKFIARGNMIDMAVGVVMGGAVTTVVNSIVNSVINPFIAMIFGKPNMDGLLAITFNGATVSFGAVLGAILNFLIIAAAVYFCILVPINKFRDMTEALLAKTKLAEQKEAEEKAAEEPSAEEQTSSCCSRFVTSWPSRTRPATSCDSWCHSPIDLMIPAACGYAGGRFIWFAGDRVRWMVDKRLNTKKASDYSEAFNSVELRGFEPLTLSMPWRCATSCAIAPWS